VQASCKQPYLAQFQHTAARRRLAALPCGFGLVGGVSTHSRPKAAGITETRVLHLQNVSTHSRPKAAGCGQIHARGGGHGFNTQPPEGGWQQSQGC